MLKLSILTAASLALAGCTTQLQTKPVSKEADATVGVLYNLPMAAFDAEARFLVKGCSILSPGGAPVLAYELVAGSAVLHLEPDPLETYSLRYELLNSPMKVTAATIKLHPNGMIKSLSAEADDRTAQVIASVSGTVLNLAKAVALAGVSATSASAYGDCADFMTERIAERQKILSKDLPLLKAADKDQKDDKALAAVWTKKLKIEQDKLAKVRERKSKSRDVDVKQLLLQIADIQFQIDLATVDGRKAKNLVLQARLASLTEDLTTTARYVGWSPRQSNGEKVCQEFSSSQAEYWTRLATSSFAPDTAKPADGKLFSAEICVQVPERARKAGTATDVVAGVKDAEYAGVVYLLPSTGYVFVGDKTQNGVKFYSANSVSLPQFGAKGLVWLKNEPFDNNSVNASFNEDGSMSELSFKAAARAERGAAAASDTAKSLADLMQLRVDTLKAKAAATDERQKKEQQNQINAIDSQIALTTKQNELDLAKASAGDPLTKEKALLQKQIEVETLKQQYDALLKKKVE